jgi:hypothetical protein
MQQLCTRQDRSGFLDRGAEDRQEGAEGLAGEKRSQKIEIRGEIHQVRGLQQLMNGFRIRHQLGLDMDCVCKVWAARIKGSAVDGYRKRSSGILLL